MCFGEFRLCPHPPTLTEPAATSWQSFLRRDDPLGPLGAWMPNSSSRRLHDSALAVMLEIRNDGLGPVVDTDLETGRAPVDPHHFSSQRKFAKQFTGIV